MGIPSLERYWGCGGNGAADAPRINCEFFELRRHSLRVHYHRREANAFSCELDIMSIVCLIIILVDEVVEFLAENWGLINRLVVSCANSAVECKITD